MFAKLEGIKSSYDYPNYKFEFLQICVDPRKYFVDTISKNKAKCPENVRDELVDRILKLKKEHGLPIVSVKLFGRAECEYPRGWITEIIQKLVENKIFVQVSHEYRGMFKPYTLLGSNCNLKTEDVYKLVN